MILLMIIIPIILLMIIMIMILLMIIVPIILLMIIVIMIMISTCAVLLHPPGCQAQTSVSCLDEKTYFLYLFFPNLSRQENVLI